MNTTATAQQGWVRRAETWLDARGKGAWIAAMVAGFVVFWPVGLALLAYMIWGKRMFAKNCHGYGRNHDQSRAWGRDWGRSDRAAFRPSGNAAFDAYKADTLRRLEDEQEAFETFLQRLRESKDKKEFDSFMEDRARIARETGPAAETEAGPAEDTSRRGEY
ncbi:DUF2852 domain-containing protein [Rhodobacter sp. Har01]|uniref:DUF2852 domain-containing protein n=1 Tax=Rhodobacter sp. Har01 TaxID=2883999 RepID=UPI001D07CCD8|nr:DUF2852 domain-containing protein [Rhodobacter sp. Har01]MCB6176911.1 DUF2852 domain-containing protein [Rhodobacter sp. Har01]